jgi:hypothetical protein
MPKDLTVILQHRPGELARLGQASGEAGVNIQGCARSPARWDPSAVRHEQAGTARRALESGHGRRGRARGARDRHPGSTGHAR